MLSAPTSESYHGAIIKPTRAVLPRVGIATMRTGRAWDEVRSECHVCVTLHTPAPRAS